MRSSSYSLKCHKNERGNDMSEKMPVLFIGHGSPMNAIEENEFTENWKRIGSELPIPKAILCVSAHWYTRKTRLSDALNPEQIYDMYGFPEKLYQYKYHAVGAPEWALKTQLLLIPKPVIDNSWGIDHGTWSVLAHLYPLADIPVYQLSIDYDLSISAHYELGKMLSTLRDQGILIIGSGNIVHNLGRVNWQKTDGYDYADTFDQYIIDNVQSRHIDNIIHFENVGDAAKLSFQTLEHYLPMVYALGASDDSDDLEIFNAKRIMGSLSMTSFIWRAPR